jgi:hypothetical protein
MSCHHVGAVAVSQLFTSKLAHSPSQAPTSATMSRSPIFADLLFFRAFDFHTDSRHRMTSPVMKSWPHGIHLVILISPLQDYL